MFYDKEIQNIINNLSIREVMLDHGENIRSGHGKSDYFICPICGGGYDNGRINKIDNYFMCFRCKAQGDSFQGKPINYIQKKLQLSFVKAIEYLADIYSINLPESKVEDKKKQSRKSALFREVAELYSKFKHPFLNSRGVSEEVLLKVKAGYTPGSVLRKEMSKKGFQTQELKEYGFLNQDGNDMWFNRIVLPITHNGYVTDFYTRRVDNQGPLKHMYLNGQTVAYGVDDIDSQPDYVDFVEAPIARLVAASKGFKNTIAIGGCTKWGSSHVKLINQIKPKKGVRIIFDADTKGQGQTQSLEFGEYLTDHDIPVKVVLLPLGKDPDEVLMQQNGIETYYQCLEKSLDYNLFKHHFLLKDVSMSTILEHVKWRHEQCCNYPTPLDSLYF